MGREISHAKDYSDEISKIIDEEIISFVKNAENNANSILNKHIDELHSIAKALLEYDSISGEEMEQVIKGQGIIRKDKPISKKRVRRRKNTSTLDGSVKTKPAT